MFGRAFRLPFRLLGIPVLLDISFLLILPLLAWLIGRQVSYWAAIFGLPPSPALTRGWMPYVLGLIAALGLFVSVVLHELGHSIAARLYGVNVKSITLWFLGGVAQFESMPTQRGAEAVIAIAGPIVSGALGGICLGIWQAVPVSAIATRFVFAYLTYMNFFLAVFNLLPALPMDGGRVLRSLLALAMPHQRATVISAGISKVLAVLMAIFALFYGAFFLLLIAVFIYLAVGAETRGDDVERLLRGFQVADLMNPQVSTVRPDLRVAELIDRMLQERRMGFPVVDENGRLRGIITLEDVQGRDPNMTVAQLMRPQAPLIHEDASAREVYRMMGQNSFARMIAIDDAGRIAGIITKTDLLRLLQIRAAGIEPHFHRPTHNAHEADSDGRLRQPTDHPIHT